MGKNPNIDFIYLDLGQVLTSIKSGIKHFYEERKFSAEQANLFWNIWGEYSDPMCRDLSLQEELIKKLVDSGIQIEKDFDFVSLTVKLMEPITPMQLLVEELAKHYQVGLITNSYVGMVQGLIQAGKMPKVQWMTIVDSSQIACIKPEKDMFVIAESKAGVSPNKIFYIDNSPRNLEMAKSMGWQVYLFNEDDTLNHVASLRTLLLG